MASSAGPSPGRIVIASDHAGLALREGVRESLERRGLLFDDLGTQGPGSVDYPDFAHEVARRVTDGRAELGILVCGTGIGMSIAANKHPGVRAAALTSAFEARMARSHNDLNILCLGERVIGKGQADDILAAFLDTPFEGGRHQRRVEKLEPQS